MQPPAPHATGVVPSDSTVVVAPLRYASPAGAAPGAPACSFASIAKVIAPFGEIVPPPVSVPIVGAMTFSALT